MCDAEIMAETLVVDNGSLTSKAGFVSDKSPRTVFPSVVGRPIKVRGITIFFRVKVLFKCLIMGRWGLSLPLWSRRML